MFVQALGREVGNFDVIVMDPPWQLASSQPTRGVAIGYAQLPNKVQNTPDQGSLSHFQGHHGHPSSSNSKKWFSVYLGNQCSLCICLRNV